MAVDLTDRPFPLGHFVAHHAQNGYYKRVHCVSQPLGHALQPTAAAAAGNEVIECAWGEEEENWSPLNASNGRIDQPRRPPMSFRVLSRQQTLVIDGRCAKQKQQHRVRWPSDNGDGDESKRYGQTDGAEAHFY